MGLELNSRNDYFLTDSLQLSANIITTGYTASAD